MAAMSCEFRIAFDCGRKGRIPEPHVSVSKTEVLTTSDNLTALAGSSDHGIDRFMRQGSASGSRLRWTAQPMKEGTAWNGHFGCSRYHKLFMFNQLGHLECAECLAIATREA